MKIVITMDSLKGSLTSMEAGMAAAGTGIRKADKKAEVFVRPLADGGEGTTQALVQEIGRSFRDYYGYRPVGNAGRV